MQVILFVSILNMGNLKILN